MARWAMARRSLDELASFIPVAYQFEFAKVAAGVITV
jgi:hypothetical protein